MLVKKTNTIYKKRCLLVGGHSRWIGRFNMTRVDRSYSPYKEVREYQDRGMLKWQGFYLSEHTTAMKEDKAPKKYFAIKVSGYLI